MFKLLFETVAYQIIPRAGNYTYQIQWVKVAVFKCSGSADNDSDSVVKRKNISLALKVRVALELSWLHLLRASVWALLCLWWCALCLRVSEGREEASKRGYINKCLVF